MSPAWSAYGSGLMLSRRRAACHRATPSVRAEHEGEAEAEAEVEAEGDGAFLDQQAAYLGDVMLDAADWEPQRSRVQTTRPTPQTPPCRCRDSATAGGSQAYG